MLRFLRILFVMTLLMVLVAACASPPPAPPTAPPTATARPTEAARADQTLRILHVDSYHAEYGWSRGLSTGLLEGLAASGYAVDGQRVIVERFFMDTKRQTDPAYIQQISEQAVADIRSSRPAVVFLTDNNAVNFVAQPLRDAGIPLVYAGLNDDPATYGLTDHPNVTGVLERPHAAQMINWIGEVFGPATRVTLLSDDSPTGRISIAMAQESFVDSDLTLVETVITNELTALQEAVFAAQETSDVLIFGTYSTIRTPDDRPLETPEVMGWVVENSAIPVLGYWGFAVEDGALGGSVIDATVQGREAGRLIGRVLAGETPGDIAPVIPGNGLLAVNRAAMQRWDVSIPLNLLEVSTVLGGA